MAEPKWPTKNQIKISLRYLPAVYHDLRAWQSHSQLTYTKLRFLFTISDAYMHILKIKICVKTYLAVLRDYTDCLWTLVTNLMNRRLNEFHSQVLIIQVPLVTPLWKVIIPSTTLTFCHDFFYFFTQFLVKRRRFLKALHFFNELLHGENFMAVFTTLSVVIWFSTGTLGIYATLVFIRHTEYGNNSHTIDFHTVL